MTKAKHEEEVFEDMSDKFEFDESSIEYVDAPLSGWLRRRDDGVWFAFDCRPIVRDLAWHWTLVPVSARCDIREALGEANVRKGGYWLSVIEDRRSGDQGKCRCVRIEGSQALPVTFSTSAR